MYENVLIQGKIGSPLHCDTQIEVKIELVKTVELHQHLTSSILAQVLVEDGGVEEISSLIVVLHLQIPQVCVGLSIGASNHLGRRQYIPMVRCHKQDRYSMYSGALKL